MRFSQHRDRLPAINIAYSTAGLSGDFADAVDGAIVKSIRAMGLGLEPNADVFDWARDDGVSNSGEGAGEVVLGVG